MRFALPILISVALVVVLLTSCGRQGSTGPSHDRDTTQYVETPTDDFEAETAAYFLSGTRLAPKYLFDKIHAELGLIRSQHDSVPGVSVRYGPYAKHSYLLLLFDSVVTNSILSGEYHSWDSLNTLYNLDTFNIRSGYVSMEFEGVQNPVVLFDIYKNLPDLWHISTSGRIGDWPVLVMRKEGETVKYFFREAWGDCPAGCIFSRFSYFTVNDSQAMFHGSYQLGSCNDTLSPPPPEWADTAWQALRDYGQYLAWSHDTLRPRPAHNPCDTISLDLPEIFTWTGNEEAILATLYLSETLNPPKTLYDRITNDLQWIRSHRPDSVGIVDDIMFRSFWNTDGIPCYWDPEEMNDSLGPSYWPFKCLMEHFSISYTESSPYGRFFLHTRGGIGASLHPCAIIEEFKIVPAITRIAVRARYDITSNVYAAMSGDTIHYYFRHAYGQLLTSPEWHYENEDFYYFESISGQPSFVGKYDPLLDTRPAWFTECELARLKKNEQPCEWVRGE